MNKKIILQDKKVLNIGDSIGITIDHKIAKRHNIKKGDTLDQIQIIKEAKNNE
jgi:hypothetical protein